MRKRVRLKYFTVMLVILMIACLLPVHMAAAANLQILQRPNVKDDSVASLGVLYAEFLPGQLKKGDTLVITLPDGFEFRNHLDQSKVMKNGPSEWMMNEYWYIKDTHVDKAFVPALNPDGSVKMDANGKPVKSGVEVPINDMINYVAVPLRVKGEDNGGWLNKGDWITGKDSVTGEVYMYWDNTVDKDPDDNVPVLITQLNEREIMLELKDDPKPGQSVYAYVHLGAVYIKSGHKGPVMVKCDAPPGAGFVAGALPLAVVPGGAVTVTAMDITSFTDNTAVSKPVKIRIKEDVKGALTDDGESLKFILPDGFEWDKSGFDVRDVWGDTKLVSKGGQEDLSDYWKANARFNEDELVLPVPAGYETSEAACVDITVNISVSDPSKAKPGEVKVQVRGKSDVGTPEVVVAKYGEHGSGSEVSGLPALFAGKLQQEIGKVVIKETAPGSLVAGRTVTLTLPANARWGKVDDKASSHGVTLLFKGFSGTDGRTAKWVVNGHSDSDEATLELSDMEVALEPGATGDLKLEIGGTAGVNSHFDLAQPLPIFAD